MFGIVIFPNRNSWRTDFIDLKFVYSFSDYQFFSFSIICLYMFVNCLTSYNIFCSIILVWIKCFAMFWYVLVCSGYFMRSMHIKPWKLPAVLGSIVVVSAMTCCVLVHSMYDLKAAHMNVQQSLIWELMLYKFELCHNAVEAAKNIHCTKGKGAVDYWTVNRWFKKFGLVCKNQDDQLWLCWSKTVDSKAMLLATEANLASISG